MRNSATIIMLSVLALLAAVAGCGGCTALLSPEGTATYEITGPE